jgi:hypothetical protein
MQDALPVDKITHVNPPPLYPCSCMHHLATTYKCYPQVRTMPAADVTELQVGLRRLTHGPAEKVAVLLWEIGIVLVRWDTMGALGYLRGEGNGGERACLGDDMLSTYRRVSNCKADTRERAVLCSGAGVSSGNTRDLRSNTDLVCFILKIVEVAYQNRCRNHGSLNARLRSAFVRHVW